MSPVKTYFGGHGRRVMADFKKRYGKGKGTRAFYATVVKNQLHGTKAQKAAQPKSRPGARRRRKKRR